MILATKYAKNVITSANPIWYRRNKSSWATLTYAAPHTVFPQCNDQEDWDHVVCEYISKIQILKPEKLAKNGVMQEIHHVLCYGSWKTTIIKTLWYIFNIQAIKQFDLQSLAGTFSTDKGRLIFKLGTPWSLIFSENLCLASHPLSCGNHWVGRLQFQCYTQAGHWKSGTPDTQLKLLDQIIDGLHIFLTYWDKAAKTDYPLVSEIKASFLSHCFFSPWLYFQIKCFYMCFDVIFNLFVETLLQMFR